MKKILMVIVLLLGGVFTSFAQSGYRGFADIGLGAGFNKVFGFNAMISTTHGYQCNGHIFTGAGVGIGYSGMEIPQNYNLPAGVSVDARVGMRVPLYANFRYDYSLISSKSFFFSTKLGYDLVADGYYISAEFGVRFGRNSAVSYNLGLGLDYTFLYGREYSYTCIMYGPMLSFGIEF